MNYQIGSLLPAGGENVTASHLHDAKLLARQQSIRSENTVGIWTDTSRPKLLCVFMQGEEWIKGEYQHSQSEVAVHGIGQ